MIAFDHRLGQSARPLGVDRRIDDMSGHAERQIGVGAERNEVLRLQLGARGVDDGKLEMAVGPRPAVSGNMFDDRQHAAVEQPLRRRAAEPRDLGRRAAIGAVADDIMGAVHRDVEHRQAIDIDPDLAQIMGDEPRAEPDEAGRLLGSEAAASRRRRRTDRRARPAARAAGRARPPDRRGWGRRSPSASRISAVRARSCSREATLRLNRIAPQGRASRRKDFSSGERARPAQPQMKARVTEPPSPSIGGDEAGAARRLDLLADADRRLAAHAGGAHAIDGFLADLGEAEAEPLSAELRADIWSSPSASAGAPRPPSRRRRIARRNRHCRPERPRRGRLDRRGLLGSGGGRRGGRGLGRGG